MACARWASAPNGAGREHKAKGKNRQACSRISDEFKDATTDGDAREAEISISEVTKIHENASVLQGEAHTWLRKAALFFLGSAESQKAADEDHGGGTIQFSDFQEGAWEGIHGLREYDAANFTKRRPCDVGSTEDELKADAAAAGDEKVGGLLWVSEKTETQESERGEEEKGGGGGETEKEGEGKVG